MNLRDEGRRKVLGLLPALPVVSALAGVAPALPVQARGTALPQVIASFSLLADIVGELLPPGITVQALVGPGIDSHGWEPRPADARRLARAEVVVVNGLGFEGWLDRLVAASGFEGTLLVASRDVVPRRFGPSTDPHAWHDINNARRYVATLAEGLVQRWPQQQHRIRSRAADYDTRLQALDTLIRHRLAAVPAERRRVLVSHDAFGYWGAAYGVSFVAARGWSSLAEPSAAALAGLIRQVRAQRVQALFLENLGDTRLMARVAAETGARIGGTLYADALSAPGGPADSFLRLLAHNARTVVDALAPGTWPAEGEKR